MKHKTVQHRILRRSSLASFAIEGIKPSTDTLKLANKVHTGKLSKQAAVSLLCEKYRSGNR